MQSKKPVANRRPEQSDRRKQGCPQNNLTVRLSVTTPGEQKVQSGYQWWWMAGLPGRATARWKKERKLSTSGCAHQTAARGPLAMSHAEEAPSLADKLSIVATYTLAVTSRNIPARPCLAWISNMPRAFRWDGTTVLTRFPVRNPWTRPGPLAFLTGKPRLSTLTI
jgi:hypothetical protein